MAADDESGRESLCWRCMRAGWWCLCPMPERMPTGAAGQTVELKDGRAAWLVDSCPMWWPDLPEKESVRLDWFACPDRRGCVIDGYILPKK